tara:strand:- start:103 stop:378 length:276 start_codon:yes stop_codon:yes gene_type:complete
MALVKNVKIDKIEILEHGSIQVRQATIVTEDGNELSRSFRRHVVVPCYKDNSGNWQDTDISGEDSEVQAVCNLKWTDTVKEAYKQSVSDSI